MMAGIAWLGRTIWLGALGLCLVTSRGEQPSSTADFAVVPAADYIRADVSMDTLDVALRLQSAGSVRRILMTCPDSYGVSGCQLAETALRNRGRPTARIEWLRTRPIPDEMEAGKTIQYIRECGARSAIILLPNYKVRRLGGLYRQLGRESAIQVRVSGRSRDFSPREWWKSREGQKRFAEDFLRLTRLL